MDITYDYYRIFYYVAKYKSFTKAAEILMNSQPNITRSMNNLEKQLGKSLFIRSNRGVQLTHEGTLLFQHVRIAYEQLRLAELELADEDDMKEGTVTISASETALHEMLLPVLKDFHTAFPGIHIRISNHTTTQAIQAVKNGLFDLAVVSTPTPIKKPLRMTHLKTFREVLVCGDRYAFLANATHHLSELTDYPLISLGRNTMTYEFYNEFYFRCGLEMHPDIEVATADQILPMISHDLGIGFIPQDMLDEGHYPGKIHVIPLYEEVPKRSICIIEDSSLTPGVPATELKKMLISRAEKA